MENNNNSFGTQCVRPNDKYDRDLYYLGKLALRLGVCIFFVVLIAKLAFGSIPITVILVLSILSVILIILGITRIVFSHNALTNSNNNNNNNNRDISPRVSTISNFRAFIRDNNRQIPGHRLETNHETIHCGNRSFGSPSLVLPPTYEPPPSYEQIENSSQTHKNVVTIC
jgi:hypothetical protein